MEGNRVEVDFCPVPLRGGKKFLRYMGIVRSNSQIETIAGLNGKILALPRGNEDGRFYLNTLLLENFGKEGRLRFFS